MASKITTDIDVDAALTSSELAAITPADRQKIDDQVRGCQRHLVDSLLTGAVCTWMTLDGASVAVAAGDVLEPGSTTGVVRRLVYSVGTIVVVAVALAAAAPGGRVRVALAGRVDPSIIGSLAAGYAVANRTTARVARSSSPGAGDCIIGVIDANGSLWLRVPGVGSGIA